MSKFSLKILVLLLLGVGSYLTIDGIFNKPARQKANRKFVIVR